MARRATKRAVRRREMTPEDLAQAVQRTYADLRPKLPNVDPGDLLLILQCMLRPFGSGRRYFLRKQGDRYVF